MQARPGSPGRRVPGVELLPPCAWWQPSLQVLGPLVQIGLGAGGRARVAESWIACFFSASPSTGSISPASKCLVEVPEGFPTWRILRIVLPFVFAPSVLVATSTDAPLPPSGTHRGRTAVLGSGGKETQKNKRTRGLTSWRDDFSKQPSKSVDLRGNPCPADWHKSAIRTPKVFGLLPSRGQRPFRPWPLQLSGAWGCNTSGRLEVS